MTTLEALRNVLVASESVTAELGARIYPQVMPQGSDPTAGAVAVISVISDTPVNSFTGTRSERLSNARAQVDLYAGTYIGAHEAADLVDEVLSGLASPELSAQLIDRQDDYEDETQLHRVRLEFSVWRG